MEGRTGALADYGYLAIDNHSLAVENVAEGRSGGDVLMTGFLISVTPVAPALSPWLAELINKRLKKNNCKFLQLT